MGPEIWNSLYEDFRGQTFLPKFTEFAKTW